MTLGAVHEIRCSGSKNQVIQTSAEPEGWIPVTLSADRVPEPSEGEDDEVCCEGGDRGIPSNKKVKGGTFDRIIS